MRRTPDAMNRRPVAWQAQRRQSNGQWPDTFQPFLPDKVVFAAKSSAGVRTQATFAAPLRDKRVGKTQPLTRLKQSGEQLAGASTQPQSLRY
jgi:hypothetical protein